MVEVVGADGFAVVSNNPCELWTSSAVAVGTVRKTYRKADQVSLMTHSFALTSAIVS